MGLLEFLNSPESRLGIGLLAAAGPRADGAGVGQRISEAMQMQDAYGQNQMKSKLLQSQIDENTSQAAMRKMQADQAQAQQLLQQRQQAALPGLYSAGSGGAPGAFDVQGALRQGFTPKQIADYAGLQNLNLPKVARTIETKGPDGQPVTMQVDDYGRPVGPGMAQWKAPMMVDQGDKRTAVDPTTMSPIASFGIGQSPDSKASNALGWANHNQAGQIAGINQDGTPSSSVEAMAQLIASGKSAPISGFALARPQGQAVMARVAQLNPNYDSTDYAAKLKASRDFGSGPQGNAMRSFAVAGDHLDQLSTLVTALGNGNTQAINKIGQYISAQTGSPAPTNFEAAKDVVSKEVIKAIVGGGGGVAERAELANTMSKANSPAQLMGVIQQYRGLMSAQHDALLAQRRAAGLPDSTLPNYSSGQSHGGVVDFGSLK